MSALGHGFSDANHAKWMAENALICLISTFSNAFFKGQKYLKQCFDFTFLWIQ